MFALVTRQRLNLSPIWSLSKNQSVWKRPFGTLDIMKKSYIRDTLRRPSKNTLKREKHWEFNLKSLYSFDIKVMLGLRKKNFRLAIKEMALASLRKVLREKAIFNLVHVLHERPDWQTIPLGSYQLIVLPSTSSAAVLLPYALSLDTSKR